MKLTTLLLAAVLAFTSSFAQEKTIRIVKGGSELETALIPELGALFTGKDGKIAVETVLPADAIPEKSKTGATAELMEGDVLISVNGESFASAGKLSDWYDGLKADTPVTVKLTRKNENLTVQFKKAATDGRKKMIFVSVDDKDGKTVVMEGDSALSKNMKWKMKDCDMDVILEDVEGGDTSDSTETIIIKKVIRKKKSEKSGEKK